MSDEKDTHVVGLGSDPGPGSSVSTSNHDVIGSLDSGVSSVGNGLSQAWANGHSYDPYARARTVEDARKYLAKGQSAFAVFQSSTRLEVNLANDMDYVRGRKWSSHAYAAAMYSKVSWNSVVGALCGMGLAHIPPYWRLDLLGGTGGTLNDHSAFMGKSGDGKNVALSLASNNAWFSFPSLGVLSPVLDEKTKSVQAVPLLYMSKVDGSKDVSASSSTSSGSGGSTGVKSGASGSSPSSFSSNMVAAAATSLAAGGTGEWVQRRYSAVLKFTEVGTIAKILGEQNGVAVWCETWSGDKLGGKAQDSARYGASVEAGRYRLVTFFGVQPANSHLFLDHDVTGLAQRILWVPVTSLTQNSAEVELEYARFAEIDPVPHVFRGMPELEFGTGALEENRKAKAIVDIKSAIDASAYRAVELAPGVRDLAEYLMITKQSGTREVEVIDSHWMLILLKQAVAESFLADSHGKDHLYVTLEDVSRAHYRLLCHEKTRKMAEEASQKNRDRQRVKMGREIGITRYVADATVKAKVEETISFTSAQKEIVRRLSLLGGEPGVLLKSGIVGSGKEMGSTMKNSWDKSIASLLRMGILRQEGTEKTGNGQEKFTYRLVADKVPDSLLPSETLNWSDMAKKSK